MKLKQTIAYLHQIKDCLTINNDQFGSKMIQKMQQNQLALPVLQPVAINLSHSTYFRQTLNVK